MLHPFLTHLLRTILSDRQRPLDSLRRVLIVKASQILHGSFVVSDVVVGVILALYRAQS